MMVAVVMTAVAAVASCCGCVAMVVASCCGSVATATPRSGSPVLAALPAARGALDERRLVGTDTSNLSALVGARAWTVGATLRTQSREAEL
jgi:hypothetical protein